MQIHSMARLIQQSGGMAPSASTSLAEANATMYNMVDLDRAEFKAKAVNVKAEAHGQTAVLPIARSKFDAIAAQWGRIGQRQQVVVPEEENKQDILHATRIPVEPKYTDVLSKFNRKKFTKNMAGKHRDDIGLVSDAMKNVRYHRMKEQEAQSSPTLGMPSVAPAPMPQMEFQQHSRNLLRREEALETLFETLKQKKVEVQQEEENLEGMEAMVYENEYR